MKTRAIKLFVDSSARHKGKVSFVFVGISSSLVYMAILSYLSIKLSWQSTPAIIVAYCFGTLVSYIGSVSFAFRKEMTGLNMIKFLVVVGLSFFINIII